MTDEALLEARIAGLPCWKGEVTLERLHGGLSNRSFAVRDRRARYVARCGGDIPVHHVFRDRERAAAAAAHAAGLSPELIYVEPGVMVMRYIEGRSFDEADVRANIARIAELLRTCHRTVARHLSGAANMFWVFHVIRDYARRLSSGGAAPAATLTRYIALADALEEVQAPLPIVFGHHDLLPGNFIDDGTRLWLVDWEYAGFGTGMFDLANVAVNASFADDHEQRLLDAYFVDRVDAVGRGVRQSFDAMKIASALRETLWAMVSQRHLDVPGVDYRAHAAAHLGRCEAAIASYVDRYRTALPC